MGMEATLTKLTRTASIFFLGSANRVAQAIALSRTNAYTADKLVNDLGKSTDEALEFWKVLLPPTSDPIVPLGYIEYDASTVAGASGVGVAVSVGAPVPNGYTLEIPDAILLGGSGSLPMSAALVGQLREDILVSVAVPSGQSPSAGLYSTVLLYKAGAGATAEFLANVVVRLT